MYGYIRLWLGQNKCLLIYTVWRGGWIFELIGLLEDLFKSQFKSVNWTSIKEYSMLTMVLLPFYTAEFSALCIRGNEFIKYLTTQPADINQLYVKIFQISSNGYDNYSPNLMPLWKHEIWAMTIATFVGTWNPIFNTGPEVIKRSLWGANEVAEIFMTIGLFLKMMILFLGLVGLH